jgi:hypothetical protein
VSSDYITPTERVYRDLSNPEPLKPAKNAPAKEPEITRAEVEEIMARRRSASPEILQYVLDNSKKFELTSYDREKLGLDLSIAVAAKMRAARGIHANPSAEFLSSVLGVEETPMGLLSEAQWFREELRVASKEITSCRQHKPPRCTCWAASRGRLYAVRQACGDRSPEGYTALKLWTALEDLEKSSQRGTGAED